MEKVTGIGGLFIRAKDPKALCAWYQKHLGIAFNDSSYVDFQWINHNNPDVTGNTVFSFFPQDTPYFNPSGSSFMINFRVKDLAQLLQSLKEEGVPTVGEPVEEVYGKFGWILDPEGNKIELWQPL